MKKNKKLLDYILPILSLLLFIVLFFGFIIALVPEKKFHKYPVGSVVLLKQDSIVAVIIGQDAYLENYDYKITYSDKNGNIKEMPMDETGILMLKK